MIIIDCSVALKWCFADEDDAYGRSILQKLIEEDAVVPGLWLYEIINTMKTGVAQKRITTAEASRYFAQLRSLPIEVVPLEIADMEIVWRLAVATGL